MVVQGVKNPLVDLLSLEDKTLDEVRFPEMMSQSQPQHTNQNHLPVQLSFSSSSVWPEDLNYFVWYRVMESVQHYPPLPLQTGLWRRAVTPPLSSASTITAPWCWQQAHAKGKENTFWNPLPVFSVFWVFFCWPKYIFKGKHKPTKRVRRAVQTETRGIRTSFSLL